MKKPLVSLVVPVYNEEETIDALYTRLNSVTAKLDEYRFELLFVNDGSNDASMDMLRTLATKDKRIAYIDLSRNFGKEAAMLAGIDHVTGDAMIMLDADLQDPPELIEQMLQEWQNGYDDVYAKRRSRQGETWFKKATSRWYYRILAKTTNVPIQPDTGDFRLLSRRAITALQQLRESDRYTKGMFSWVGFDKKEILYDRSPRVAGTTKWSYPKLVKFAINGITSFTTAPLRIASVLGLIISIAAFIYIIVIVTRTILFGNDLAGYPSLMAVILFLGGVQLLSLGIIGEYIARIFSETKHRPVYIIKDHHKATHDSSSKSS